MSETTVGTTAATENRVNKSKLVFAAFQTEGLDTPANDLVKFIKETAGVDVTVSLVNNLRSKVRKAKEERKRKRNASKTAPATEEQTTPVATAEDPLAKLFKVKEFASTVGGLAELKSLVGKLEALAA